MLRVALVLALIGCTKSSPSPPPPTPTTIDAAPVPVPVPPSTPGKWDCAVDGDCINSCAEGAVNRVWYETTRPPECEDGCANQIAEAPRCIDKGCVAFRSDPRDQTKITQAPDCTRRP